MPTRTLSVLTFLLALTVSHTAHAQRAAEYDPHHPFSIGTRLLTRVGPYVMGGLGGEVRIRPHRLIAIEAFADSFAGVQNGAFRHDHEVGTTIQYTGIGGRRWSVYPMVGACALLAMVHAPQDGSVTHDIQFGVHGGVGAEFHIVAGLTVKAQIEAIGYVGHEINVYRWSTEVSNDLHYTAVGQAVLGANYYF